MNFGNLGPLFGALPGIALLLWNMRQSHLLQKRVEALAWKDHDWHDTQTSRGQMAKISRSPDGYVDPSDSPEMVTAKRELLAALPTLQRRHWLFFAITLAGGAVGAVVTSSTN